MTWLLKFRFSCTRPIAYCCDPQRTRLGDTVNFRRRNQVSSRQPVARCIGLFLKVYVKHAGICIIGRSDIRPAPILNFLGNGDESERSLTVADCEFQLHLGIQP